MWFKHIQLYQLPHAISNDQNQIEKKLAALAFRPCLPSLPSSQGWVSPIDHSTNSFVYTANGFVLVCLQIEEKVLPSAVIKKNLTDRIKQLENTQQKISQKEKLNLKDEIIHTLLPQAFTQFIHIYAYFDTRRNWLVINTCQNKRIKEFLSLFKRTLEVGQIIPLDIKKPVTVMTDWLKNGSDLDRLDIKKSCVLQDYNQKNRIVRCQEQSLFSQPFQNLLKDGLEVKQLALSWYDKIDFLLTDDFSIRNIQFKEEVRNLTKLREDDHNLQFDTDFFIMTQTLNELFEDLLKFFQKKDSAKPINVIEELAEMTT